MVIWHCFRGRFARTPHKPRKSTFLAPVRGLYTEGDTVNHVSHVIAQLRLTHRVLHPADTRLPRLTQHQTWNSRDTTVFPPRRFPHRNQDITTLRDYNKMAAKSCFFPLANLEQMVRHDTWQVPGRDGSQRPLAPKADSLISWYVEYFAQNLPIFG